jgi:hypothetical protein
VSTSVCLDTFRAREAGGRNHSVVDDMTCTDFLACPRNVLDVDPRCECFRGFAFTVELY